MTRILIFLVAFLSVIALMQSVRREQEKERLLWKLRWANMRADSSNYIANQACQAYWDCVKGAASRGLMFKDEATGVWLWREVK